MEPQESHNHDHGHAHAQRAPWLTAPVAIIIAGAIIGISVIVAFKQPSGGAAAAGAVPNKQAVNVKDVKITASDPYIGNANAKVTLVSWEDYQCPFCKAVEVGGIPQITVEPSMPTLIKEYVDTGKVRIVFKDFAFLGKDSITGALYEHAIWEKYPEKFGTWHQKMFEAQDAEGDTGFGNEASILKLIATIPGMDVNALKALVAQNKDKYTAIIDADRTEGASFGIQGTPGFVTGKILIDGAQSLSSFKAAIDPQL